MDNHIFHKSILALREYLMANKEKVTDDLNEMIKKSKIKRNQLFLNQIKCFIEELKGNIKNKYLDEGINTSKLLENIQLSAI